jgi:hypothetical protein
MRVSLMAGSQVRSDGEVAMVNIKAKGFENLAQLQEHLAELEEESPADEQVPEASPSPQEQIAELRRELAQLQARLVPIHAKTEGLDVPSRRDVHLWLRIVIAAATTLVLDRVVQHFRPGAPGAAIVPLLTARRDGRI